MATVAFFALWTVALKGHGAGSGSSSGVGQYQPAINAAKSVQHTVDSAAAKSGGTPAATSTLAAKAPAPAAKAAPAAPAKATAPAANAPAPAKSAAAASPSTPAVHGSRAAVPGHHAAVKLPTSATPAPAARLNAAAGALKAGKVLALLFYNPAGADDQSVKQELATISTHHGRVLKLAIPLDELPNYAVVTSQVPVNFSPTLVIIDAARQAQQIAGFADSFEISQRIDEALAVHRAS